MGATAAYDENADRHTLVEEIAAKVHEAWMETKREQGVESRPSEWGEEQMVPYRLLSERAKDLDRSTVKAVLAAVDAAGLSLRATGPARDEGLRADVSEVNDLLGINVWDVRSFRADVRIDFDEYGGILAAALLNAPGGDTAPRGSLQQPSDDGWWQHRTDGSRCPEQLCNRERPDPENYWWCLTHRAWLEWVRPGGGDTAPREDVSEGLIADLRARVAHLQAVDDDHQQHLYDLRKTLSKWYAIERESDHAARTGSTDDFRGDLRQARQAFMRAASVLAAWPVPPGPAATRDGEAGDRG